MPKEEWGTKRLCPETGKRFYDLNATPIISPYTMNEVVIESTKSRTMSADAEDAQTAKLNQVEDDDLVLDDDADVDLDDDLLDDDDDDTVSFDDLADVAANNDDE